MADIVTSNGTGLQQRVACDETRRANLVRAVVAAATESLHARLMSVNFPNLPTAIAAYKTRTGNSLADLARAMGVSRATATRWTQGEEPEVKRLRQLAKELGCTIGYLAADDEVAHDAREIELLKRWRRQPEFMRKIAEQALSVDMPSHGPPDHPKR